MFIFIFNEINKKLCYVIFYVILSFLMFQVMQVFFFSIKKAFIFHNVLWNYLLIWVGMGVWGAGGAADFFYRFKGGHDQKSLRTTALAAFVVELDN